MSAEIDEAIQACVWPQWMKVARLLVDVSRKLGAPEDHPRFEEIARRVRAMVEGGEIESRGDISKWRFSEVRRAPSRGDA